MKALQSYLERGAEELGIAISSRQLESFTMYANEMCKWNRKINLTSITLPEEIAVKHFLDSLTILKHVDIRGKLIDLGSGGGFPGIPIKILAPDMRIVSVDAVEKKINFQRHVIRTLDLNDFTALHSRVENLPPIYKNSFNCVVSRAFTDITEFVKYALPFLAEQGIIIAMKGKDGRKEADAAIEKLNSLGAIVSEVHEFQLPILKDLRTLVMIRKIESKN